MNILNIDSTGGRLSISLSREGVIASSVSRDSGRRYMQMIMEDIDRTLEKGGIGIGGIDAVGINKGPGDFTGTRIGISVAKTLGWALNIPVYGINALDVLACSMVSSNFKAVSTNISSGKSTMIIPCLDVRKGELYFSLYEVKKGKSDNDIIACIDVDGCTLCIERRTDNILVNADAFSRTLDEQLKKLSSGKRTVIMGGSGILSYETIFREITDSNSDLTLDKTSMGPDPASLDACVRQFVKNKIPGQRVDPVYVREFVPFGK